MLNNIKKYAIDYIQQLHTDTSSKNVKEKIKRLRTSYAYKLYKIPDIKRIVGNNLNLHEDGTYLELEFIRKFILFNGKYQLNYTIEKIPEKNGTVDFLIKNDLNQELALFECTTFTVNKDCDIARLNKALIDVINTPSALVPEFHIPESYLTTLLGFKDIKKKITDKSEQFDKYLKKNPNYSILRKFIVMDLHWFIFDARVHNGCIGSIIRKWKAAYQLGEDKYLQDRILKLINGLRVVLEKHDLSIILAITPMNNSEDRLIIVDKNKIYAMSWENFIQSKQDTNDLLVYDEPVLHGWCENNLFYTIKQKVKCPRFYNLIESFIIEFIKLSLQNLPLAQPDFQTKIINEIKWLNSLRNNYMKGGSNQLKNEYEMIINSSDQDQKSQNIMMLLYTLHYVYEELFYYMRSNQLIGYQFTWYEILITYGENHFNAMCLELNLEPNESNKSKFYNAVALLNANKFNKVRNNSHYNILFEIF